MRRRPPSFYFASSAYTDSWQRAGIQVNREAILEHLLTPVTEIGEHAEDDLDKIGARVYANKLNEAGIGTLGYLLCIGTNPTLKLAGVNRGNVAAFGRGLVEFWPRLALPPWPSPAINGSMYPVLRSVPAFPWIVDCFNDEHSINQSGVRGVVPLREKGWTVELLLSTPANVLTSIFEARKGRTREIIEYYTAYAADFEPSQKGLDYEKPVDWMSYTE